MIKSISRRDFMKGMMVGGVAVGSAGLLAACGSSSSSSTSTSETESTDDTAASTSASETTESSTETTVDSSRATTSTSGELLDYLTVAVSDDVTNWDPNQQIDTSGFPMRRIVYQTLFAVVENEYYPCAAKGYTVVDDYHWDVELWDNIYDTEGNNLTADDVVFCYEERIAAGTTAKYDAFESVEKIDDYTVRFTWTDSLYTISSLEIIWGETYLYTQAAYEAHNFATDPIGTGPYYVSELISGSKVILDVNEDYWKLNNDCDLTPYDMATVQTIEYDIITESTQNYMGLQTGSLDFSMNVPDENIADFAEGGQFSDDFSVYQRGGTATYVVTCNQSEGALGTDENFRLAVYYALSNEAIATAGGNFTAATYFGNPNCSDWVDAWADVDSYVNTYDPELAKEYLDKSSYNGEKLVLLCESQEGTKNMMTMVQSLLLNIGIDSSIEAYDYTTVVSRVVEKDSWDIVMFYYGGSVNVSGMNRILNDDEWGTGCSFGFVDDDTLDELFDTAYTLDGHTDETMTELTEYIIEKAYYDAVCYNFSNVIYSNKFAELVFEMTGRTIMINACEYYVD